MPMQLPQQNPGNSAVPRPDQAAALPPGLSATTPRAAATTTATRPARLVGLPHGLSVAVAIITAVATTMALPMAATVRLELEPVQVALRPGRSRLLLLRPLVVEEEGTVLKVVMEAADMALLLVAMVLRRLVTARPRACTRATVLGLPRTEMETETLAARLHLHLRLRVVMPRHHRRRVMMCLPHRRVRRLFWALLRRRWA